MRGGRGRRLGRRRRVRRRLAGGAGGRVLTGAVSASQSSVGRSRNVGRGGFRSVPAMVLRSDAVSGARSDNSHQPDLRPSRPGRRVRRGSGAVQVAQGHNAPVTTAELQRVAAELGLDAVGVTRAEAYTGTERHIRERRARGLFGRMRFTMARPEVSCHPEALLDGARTVVSAALCYYAPEPDRGREGTAGCRATSGTTATPTCARSSTRSAARSAASTACSSTRTSTSTARRPCARASASTARTRWCSRAVTARGSCSGRSSRRPSSSRRRRSIPAAARARAASTPARPARSTSRACSTRRDASRTGRRCPSRCRSRTARRSARRSTAATSARTSARGTAASSGGARSSSPTPARTSIWSRGSRPTGARSSTSVDRLYVPRNDARWLRRNALVALGNVGDDEPRTRAALERLRGRRRRAARRARAVGARAHRGADGVNGDDDAAAASSRSCARNVARRAAVRRDPRPRRAHAARVDRRLGRRRCSSAATTSRAEQREQLLARDRPRGATVSRGCSTRRSTRRASRRDTFTLRLRRRLDMAELVDEAVAAANASGASGVVRDVQPGLPHVSGDRGRLRQVLGEPDRQRGQVLAAGQRRSRWRRRRSNGRVEVDGRPITATGSPPEDQEMIFEQFGRVDGTEQARQRARPLHLARDRRGARRHARASRRRPARAPRSRLSLAGARLDAAAARARARARGWRRARAARPARG